MIKVKSTFLVLIFLLTFFPSNAQWIPCQGIEGANTEDIILHDSDLFIVTSGNGIYKKNISATTWDSACVAGGFWQIRSTGNALFCFGPLSGFLLSMYNGSTWEEVYEIQYVYDLETIENFVFVAVDYQILRSENDGLTWDTITPYPGTDGIEGLFAQEGILFCKFYGVDSVYRSDDYGESWTQIQLTGVEGYIHDIYFFDGKLWIGSMSGAYVYNNNDSTWSNIQDSIPDNTYVNSFIEDSGFLYCCTNKGYFRFNAQNSIWVDESEGLESLVCVAACQVGNSIYLATGSGPFYKPTEGIWNADYDNLFQLNISQVYVVGSRVYALSNDKIFFSDNIENGFEILQSQGYCASTEWIITNTAWYAGSSCGFLISLDSGYNWAVYNAGMEGKNARDIAVVDSFYFATAGGLFRTRNDSIAWEKVPNELGSANIWGVSSINNIVFASRYDGDTGVYRSSDYGTTFLAVPEGDASAPDIIVKYNRVFILNYGSVIYSADSGNSWQTLISGFDDIWPTCMDVSNSFDIIVLGGQYNYYNYYLKLFTPENQSGLDICGNLVLSSYPFIRTVFLNNGRIYTCPSSGGLWYRDDLMVGINDDDLSKVSPSNSMFLFPNPASDILTISNNVSCSPGEYLIFNSTGKLMMMRSYELDKSESTIDVSMLSRGVYYVVIRNNLGISQAGKFVKL